jgi:hypothetical protein
LPEKGCGVSNENTGQKKYWLIISPINNEPSIDNNNLKIFIRKKGSKNYFLKLLCFW